MPNPKFPGWGIEIGEILSALKAHGYRGAKVDGKPIWNLTKEGKSIHLQLIFLSQSREWIVLGSNCHLKRFQQLIDFTVRRVRSCATSQAS